MKHLKILFFLTCTFVFANNPNPVKINWISFEKAIELSKTNPKPILIDVYTDWCGWCKKMDATTYDNKTIVEYINNNFYAVKFDAEQKEAITFKGETFNYQKSGRSGVHELAYALLQGKLSYPSTVFLDKETNYIQAIPGFIQTEKMEKIVAFMANEVYTKNDWTTFDKEFKSQL